MAPTMALITGTFMALASRLKLTRSPSGKKVVLTPAADSELDQSKTSLPDIPIVTTLKSILLICNTVAEAMPYTGIKAVTSALLELFEQYEVSEDNVQAINELAEMLSQLQRIISPCQDSTSSLPGEVKEQLNQLSIKIAATEEDIKKLTNRSKLSRLVRASSDAKVIAELAARITGMMNRTEFHAVINTSERVKKVADQTDRLHREGIFHRTPIAYEASYSANNRQLCLEGTRTKIIRTIEDWRTSGQAQIFRLTGSSGTGKTSIACSIVHGLTGLSDVYFADFFCSSSLDNESDAKYVFPTIAKKLACKDSQFFNNLESLGDDLKTVSYAGRREQLRKLLLEPLKTLSRATFLVIDGLDECKNGQPEEVFRELVDSISEAPLLKVLITCRSSCRWVKPISPSSCVSLCLDNHADVSPQEVREDMHRVLTEHLQGKFKNSAIKQIADEVVKSGQRSFILSPTLYEDLKPSPSLSISSETMRGLKDRLASGGVNVLYDNLVQKALPSVSETTLRQNLYLALTIAVSPSSPSLEGLACLLDLNYQVLLKFFKSFPAAVLGISDDGFVRVRHVSFEDYLNAPPRPPVDAPTPIVHLDYQVSVRLLLRFMRHNLQRNIKGLRDFVPASEINSSLEGIQDRGSKLQALIYACRYWFQHLEKVSIDDLDGVPQLLQELEDFLETKALQWIELLMVEELWDVVRTGLTKAKDWVQKHGSSSCTLQTLLDDLLYSLETFQEPVLQNPLQVYHSFLLPLTPSGRRLSNVYAHVKPSVIVSAVLCHRRDMFEIGYVSKDSKLVLSPRGDFAVISPDAPVKIWGTYPEVCVLRESPDHANETVLDAAFVGAEKMVVLTKSRESFELRLWCIRTLTVQRLVLEEAAAGLSLSRGPFLTLSSDSSHFALWRCSMISIWEVKTMKEVRTFSPPCRLRRSILLALCSRYLLYDLRLFDLKTATELLSVDCDLENPTCCGFSHDGNMLVIGGDRGDDSELVLYRIEHGSRSNVAPKIRIVGRSRAALRPASLIFSPKGFYILSTSPTHAFTVWRTSKLEQIAEFGTRHRGVAAIAFQPNDRLLSARTVCGNKAAVMLETFDLKIPASAHDRVSALTFSDDGSKIASGSEAGIVTTWDSKMTEVFQCWDDDRHPAAITYVSFSSNGNFLASISPERVDVSTLEKSERCLSFRNMKTLRFSVCAFSEDSSRFSTLCMDECNGKPVVRIWDTSVWDTQSSVHFTVDLPLLGSVRSIAIANEGDKFAFNDTRSLFVCSVPTEASPFKISAQIEAKDDSLLQGLSFTAHDKSLLSTDGGVFEITENMALRQVARADETPPCGIINHLRKVRIRHDGWVVDTNNILRCWIPKEYSSKLRAHASHKYTLVFCTQLGSVLVLSVPPVKESD